MLDCKDFYDSLLENNVSFYAGVPDSLLKDFCAYITDYAPTNTHIISANEGNAIALATGNYLATQKIGLVYMQNSGMGNAINPLTSLTDSSVYSIPMLLLIGWRGEPGVTDEPQHLKQGEITIDLLNTLGIPHMILSSKADEAKEIIAQAISTTKRTQSPYAIVVREGTFNSYQLMNREKTNYELSREEAIKIIVSSLEKKAIVISTTGKASRELFEYRKEINDAHDKDFLTVGSMGHSSQIALGISLAQPDRKVYCIDGDGALIMHMGSLAIIGDLAPANFKHIIINNGAHDSVGGQSTVGLKLDITGIAKSCNYKNVFKAESRQELQSCLEILNSSSGPGLLEIKVNKGSRKDLGRPTKSPKENKEGFMRYLSTS